MNGKTVKWAIGIVLMVLFTAAGYMLNSINDKIDTNKEHFMEYIDAKFETMEAKFETMEAKILNARSRGAMNYDQLDTMSSEITNIKIELARIKTMLENNGFRHSGP